jgi:opacity protein-like surface antigen
MKRLIVASLIALAPLVSTMAYAQSQETQNRTQSNQSAQLYGPTAGSHEFTLSGQGTSDRGLDNGSFGITGSYGWYFSRELEASVRQSVNWASVNNGNDRLNGSTRGALDYHFDVTDRFRPFVGASIGVIYGDAVNETGIIGPEVGMKYYLNPTTFIIGQMEYQYMFDDGDEIDNNFDNGAFAYTLGLGLNF